MPAKSTLSTQQFSLHSISFIPFPKKLLLRPPPTVDSLKKIVKEAQKKVLPKILTRFIVKHHCSKKERGMIDSTLQTEASVSRLLAGIVIPSDIIQGPATLHNYNYLKGKN